MVGGTKLNLKLDELSSVCKMLTNQPLEASDFFFPLNGNNTSMPKSQNYCEPD